MVISRVTHKYAGTMANIINNTNIDKVGRENAVRRLEKDMKGNPLLSKHGKTQFSPPLEADIKRMKRLDAIGNPRVFHVSPFVYEALATYIKDGNVIEDVNIKVFMKHDALYLLHKETKVENLIYADNDL